MNESENLLLNTLTLERVRIGARTLMSMSAAEQMTVEVAAEVFGDALIGQLRTYLLAKKHVDEWDSKGGVITWLAPGVINGVKAWLNTQHPFKDRVDVKVEHAVWWFKHSISTTYLCPHLEVPATGRHLEHFQFLTQDRVQPPVEDDETGTCDFCDVTFDVGSQIDHCGECGNCWAHCVNPSAHEPKAP